MWYVFQIWKNSEFFFLFHIIFLIIFHKAIFPFQKFPIPPFMLLPSPSWCIPLQFYRFIDFIDLYLSHDPFWESPVPLAKYFNYFPVGFSFRKVTGLTHSFPMHPLSAPENIRKLYGGRERVHWERIWDPVKHIRWSLFAKQLIAKSCYLLSHNSSTIDVWRDWVSAWVSIYSTIHTWVSKAVKTPSIRASESRTLVWMCTEVKTFILHQSQHIPLKDSMSLNINSGQT